MIAFDTAHGAVHFPADRRHRLWIRPSILIGIAAVIASMVAAAWIEVAVAGLPHIPPVPLVYPSDFAGPARLPALGSLLPLLQLPLRHHAHPQRPFHPRRSSAALFQRRLHAGQRVDSPHADQGSARPPVDGQRRCPLSHSARRHARLPAYHRRCARLALHQRPWLHPLRRRTSSPCSSPPTSGGASCPHRPRSLCRRGIPGSTTPPFICLRSPTAFTATTLCSRSPTSPSSLSSARWRFSPASPCRPQW